MSGAWIIEDTVYERVAGACADEVTAKRVTEHANKFSTVKDHFIYWWEPHVTTDDVQVRWETRDGRTTRVERIDIGAPMDESVYEPIRCTAATTPERALDLWREHFGASG